MFNYPKIMTSFNNILLNWLFIPSYHISSKWHRLKCISENIQYFIHTFLPRNTIRPPVSKWTLKSFGSFYTINSRIPITSWYALFSGESVHAGKSSWSRETWETNDLVLRTKHNLTQIYYADSANKYYIIYRITMMKLIMTTCRKIKKLCTDVPKWSLVTCIDVSFDNRFMLIFLPGNPSRPIKPGSPLSPGLPGVPSGPMRPRNPGGPGWPWSPEQIKQGMFPNLKVVQAHRSTNKETGGGGGGHVNVAE